MKRHGGGNELWKLKHAIPELHAALEPLRRFQGATNRCTHCHARKPEWQGLVADAGQMYEALAAKEVGKAIDRLLQKAVKATGVSTVTVVRHRSRRAYFGGSLIHRSDKTMTYEFAELKACVLAALSAKYVSVGDRVVKMKGVPTGGFMSKIAASCVLVDAESKFKDRYFGHAGVPWTSRVAAKRYVDDLIWISNQICLDCLKMQLKEAYPVKFDVAHEGETLHWLDISFSLRTMTHTYRHRGFSTRPPWASTQASLRSYILGRLSRANELQLDPRSSVDMVLHMLVDLHKCGWQHRHFRAVVHGSSGIDATGPLTAFRSAVRHLNEEALLSLARSLQSPADPADSRAATDIASSDTSDSSDAQGTADFTRLFPFTSMLLMICRPNFDREGCLCS